MRCSKVAIYRPAVSVHSCVIKVKLMNN